MKIKEPENYILGPNGSINQGRYAGRSRYYRDALLATLRQLRPKVCLEIGAHLFQSSRVFQTYFDECCPDGILITCDIKQYTKLDNCPNIKFVQVYPHATPEEVGKWHAVSKEEFLPDYDGKNSEFENFKLLRKATTDLGLFGGFDFIFLDGCHTEQAVKTDVKISSDLLSDKGYIVFDDTEEYEHFCAPYYHEVLKSKWNTYDYDDWSQITGCGLMWHKNDN